MNGLTRREFIKASIGGMVLLGSGVWVPRKARAGTIYHASDWSYAIGSGVNSNACVDGPFGVYRDLENGPKWHSASVITSPNPLVPDDSLEVVNNPPAGCPTPNAFKMNWHFNDAMGPGSWVKSPVDGKLYWCINNHTSTNSNKPPNATYWELDHQPRTKGMPLGPNWKSGRQYWAGISNPANQCQVTLYTQYGGTNWTCPTLPNPFYARCYFYSESWMDYAEGGRKWEMWFGGPGGYAGGPLIEIYNKDYIGPVDLPLPVGYDEGGFIVIFSTSGLNDYAGGVNWSFALNGWRRIDGVDHGMKITGRNVWQGVRNFGVADKPATWPACPETGAKASEGLLLTNTWHCIELGFYGHHTDGWIRVWVDGKMCINACKEAWPGRTAYNTLPHMRDGVTDAYPSAVKVPGYRNGGVARDHAEYMTGWRISDSYIGLQSGGRTTALNPPFNPPRGVRIVK